MHLLIPLLSCFLGPAYVFNIEMVFNLFFQPSAEWNSAICTSNQGEYYMIPLRRFVGHLTPYDIKDFIEFYRSFTWSVLFEYSFYTFFPGTKLTQIA